jgi:hypothetical protein
MAGGRERRPKHQSYHMEQPAGQDALPFYRRIWSGAQPREMERSPGVWRDVASA